MATIHQIITLPGTPEKVFHAFLSSGEHTAFTSAVAEISAREGDTFSTFDGYATGKNIEIIPNKKIVQSWRSSDWPVGAWSTLTIELRPGEEGGTLVDFTQVDVPEEFKEEIEKGWVEWYWEPLKKYMNAS